MGSLSLSSLTGHGGRLIRISNKVRTREVIILGAWSRCPKLPPSIQQNWIKARKKDILRNESDFVPESFVKEAFKFILARCSTPFLPFCRSTSVLVLLDVTSYWTVSSKLNLTLRRCPQATSSTTTRHPYPIWFYHFWFHTYDYIYSYR